MKTNKLRSSCFDLPEDIVVRILYRLPVKSLIRFTSVSKRWKSIISDPKFAKSHYQLACELGTLSRKVLLISYPRVGQRPDPGDVGRSDPGYVGRWKLPPRFQSLGDNNNFSVTNYTTPFEENRDLEEMGSCNGLILLGQPGGGCYKSLCIWNLSTGFFRKIPDPSFRVKPIESIDDDYLYFISTGFGHVSASDDYKLVFVIPAIGDLLEIHVFSMRANVWKVITAPYAKWPGWEFGHGTFLHGAVHWVIGSRNVCAFDLAEEGLRQLPLPPVLCQNEDDDLSQNEDDDDPNTMITLVHLGGYLCIWSRKPFRPEHFEVWAMTVYGDPESWGKLFQCNLREFPDVFTTLYTPWDLCFITENETMVIRLYKELFWIECREKPVCTGRYRLEDVHPVVPGCLFHFHATTYDETLLSVAEC